MSRTASAAALLRVALQDLHAGKEMQVDRLGALVDAVRDPGLQTLLSDEIERAAAQRDRLARLTDVGGAPKNLWMTGILDDAERDTRSHQPGVLLDIAVIGAVRKAKAAEIVSSETAIALAIGQAPAMLEPLRGNHAEETATDQALSRRLEALSGGCADLF